MRQHNELSHPSEGDDFKRLLTYIFTEEFEETPMALPSLAGKTFHPPPTHGSSERLQKEPRQGDAFLGGGGE